MALRGGRGQKENIDGEAINIFWKQEGPLKIGRWLLFVEFYPLCVFGESGEDIHGRKGLWIVRRLITYAFFLGGLKQLKINAFQRRVKRH